MTNNDNDNRRAAIRADLRAKVPAHTLKGLDGYVEKHEPVGDFLHAVLTDRLFAAIGRADPFNRPALHDICIYIYNELPSACWGSPEKVDKWLTWQEPDHWTRVRDLKCCVCGDMTRGRQWRGRDTGYGVCPPCARAAVVRGESDSELEQMYGVAGVHYDVHEVAK